MGEAQHGGQVGGEAKGQGGPREANWEGAKE